MHQLLNRMSLLVLATMALLVGSGCREKKTIVLAEDSIEFAPQVGERWVYAVRVQLDAGADAAQLTGEDIYYTAEGAVTEYQQERRYVGKVAPKEGLEPVHCFEISRDGELVKREFSEFSPKGIFARGFQEKDEPAVLFDPPVMLVPFQLGVSAAWSLQLPNPKDPEGPPLLRRNFQYRGAEKIQLPIGEVEAHHVKVLSPGKGVQSQRDFWFEDRMGFVKERRAYFDQERRLILVEEELIEHQKP